MENPELVTLTQTRWSAIYYKDVPEFVPIRWNKKFWIRQSINEVKRKGSDNFVAMISSYTIVGIASFFVPNQTLSKVVKQFSIIHVSKD